MAFTQSTVLGTQSVNGSYATYNLTDYGIFRQVRLQATSSAATGTRNWLFAGGTAPGAVDYTIKWCSYTGGLTLASYNQTIAPVTGTASALYNYSPGGADGLMPAITSGNYYTFNITEYSVAGTPANEYMSVLQTTYNPVSITSVTQSPLAAAVYPENSVYVTVNTSATPSAGEYVYVRYASSFNFTSSTLLQVTITGTSGTVEIPCQAAGDSIYYYAYSSNRTSASITSDVGTYGQVAHDMSTLSINNNGGPNYSYKVLPSVGFCGNYYVPSVCYPTIASFVSALNAGTVSCPVICNVAAGHTETAPVGGINLTQTGTAANTITFIKNGAGANPIIYAQTGTVSMTGSSTIVDGIFSLNGSDYITIDGIDLVDNNASAPGTMEYGYALFKNSATDGCQNNTIKNCSITLNRTNSATGPGNFMDGSRGIFAGNLTRTGLTTLLTITTTSGRNDNNLFIGNTIKNVATGIIVRGFSDASPYTYYDQNNTTGQAGAGNTIENYGGSSITVYGIYYIHQNNADISYNSINNSASGGTAHLSTLYGIFHSSNSTAGTILPISLQITNNTITLSEGAVSSQVTGIRAGNASVSAVAVNITNNTIQNCTYVSGASGVFIGIDQKFDATTNTISNNTISNNTFNTSTTSPIYLILDNNNSTYVTIDGNIMNNNNKTVSAAGSLYGYNNSTSGSAAGSTIDITNNTIDNLTVVSGSTGYVGGIYCNFANGTSVKTVNNNSVSNITAGSGTTFWTSGIMVNNMPLGSSVSNNTVSDISSSANALGINLCAQATIITTSNLSYTCSGNSVSNISSTGASSTVCGIAMYAGTSGGSSVTANNNVIDNITSSGTSTPIVRGISLGGGTSGMSFTINGNNISNVKHTAVSGTCSPIGIYLTPASPLLTVAGNDINNISGSAANESVCGIYLNSGTTTYSIYNNFIQRLTAPSATNNLSIVGISMNATLCTYNISYNTIALGENATLSGGSGFGVAGIYFPNAAATTPLNLRNNIIYIKATPSGTGVASCVRRAGGTALSIASNFMSVSNNNYYFINTNTWNYVYVEGTTTSTIVNGWAWSGATADVSRNLNNDPCFNIAGAAPTSYKGFMSPRESNSYYDIPPFAGGAVLPDNLKLTPGATTYAESGAVVLAGITADYEGDVRSGTTPDIGADEGAFVAQTPDCYLLPLELIAFTGWYNGGENELHWTTATEINSAYFGVEKSINGIDFYQIGVVEAAGNSLIELNYEFFDDDPVSGINYYRLKMMDVDGAFEYSNTIAIRVDEDGGPQFIVYPNPVASTLNFSINSNADQTVIVEFTDIPGRKLLHRKLDLHEGQNTFSIDVSLFASATYFIYYYTDTGLLEVARFVKE